MTDTEVTSWDYLIVTASHEEQARAYRGQLDLRRRLGFLPDVRNILVVPDPGGIRIGSGGSTILCLREVLRRESPGSDKVERGSSFIREIFRDKRILIVHAGGDSRRLPAYGPCGKLFIPVPGEDERALGLTLFDRQMDVYTRIPPHPEGLGQVVVTTGDVFLDFETESIRYGGSGITGLACQVPPETAARHGVFCSGPNGRVRRFLQKPSVASQRALGALNPEGQALLDIGVMSFDAEVAARMLEFFETDHEDLSSSVPSVLDVCLEAGGVDFYRDFCCALGSEVDIEEYLAAVRASGSRLPDTLLRRIFQEFSRLPFSVHPLSHCTFLHFGTPRQLVVNGGKLLRREGGSFPESDPIDINNDIEAGGRLTGSEAWVEGCRIAAPLDLGGGNTVIGVDIDRPLRLPSGICLDVIPGRGEEWFVRVYGIDDRFKLTLEQGAVFCGRSLEDWMISAGVTESDLWEDSVPSGERTLWNARLFPVVRDARDYRRWLWLTNPEKAAPDDLKTWRDARRFSLAGMSRLTDHTVFHQRRLRHRAMHLLNTMPSAFRPESRFSASELALTLENLEERERPLMLAAVLSAALGPKGVTGTARLAPARILHTLATASTAARPADNEPGIVMLRQAALQLAVPEKERLREAGLDPAGMEDAAEWSRQAHDAAFRHLGRTIVLTGTDGDASPPQISIRDDEIVWARAPARLDLGGGWTDTPPYSLENGGRVINAAVILNGQPPIQVYARRTARRLIRIASIDHGEDLTISNLNELLDYREATSRFGLAKAALALMGFDPERAAWPSDTNDLAGMLAAFGGGIELTTLAAIPSGSGLGTSSIMGAVLIAVIGRLIGREPTQRELFHKVLQLEQELTTGGGWQDQIGGTVPGVKLISTEPGLYPDPRIQNLVADVLEPAANQGRTLLYYTGLRRLAKNILQNVVGNYLDRSRSSLLTLGRLHELPPLLADAISRRDLPRFGDLIDRAWRLNKEIDPESTNPVVEEILARIRPHICGAKLLGAGGGGFLLMICPTPEDADALRTDLELKPPNPLARFFEFSISRAGLEVTVC